MKLGDKMLLEILFLASVGAIIGWITNILAIKMLFRPLKPIKIPFINMELQGLIPKRRLEIAKNISQTIENELISTTEILHEFLTEDRKKELLALIKLRLVSVISIKLPLLIPSAIKGKIIDYINDQIEQEGLPLLDSIIEEIVKKVNDEIKIGDMVEKKLNDFDLLKIEEIILGISSNELKHIEVLGGVLGFFIGLIQGLIIQFI